MPQERYVPPEKAPMGWPSPPVEVPEASDVDDDIPDDDEDDEEEEEKP